MFLLFFLITSFPAAPPYPAANHSAFEVLARFAINRRGLTIYCDCFSCHSGFPYSYDRSKSIWTRCAGQL